MTWSRWLKDGMDAQDSRSREAAQRSAGKLRSRPWVGLITAVILVLGGCFTWNQVQRSAAEAWCEDIADAIDAWRAREGRFPTEPGELERALPPRPWALRTGNGPYFSFESESSYSVSYQFRDVLVLGCGRTVHFRVHELNCPDRDWSSHGYIGPG